MFLSQLGSLFLLTNENYTKHNTQMNICFHIDS